MHELDALHHALGFVMCPVVGHCVDFKRGDFEPAIGFEVFKRLPEDVVVIADEAFELTAVDVIKGFAVGPGLFEVVHFESAVGRDPIRVRLSCTITGIWSLP